MALPVYWLGSLQLAGVSRLVSYHPQGLVKFFRCASP
jgi:hypothetical protein